MTDREKAIVMAYTGYTMLTGDKLGLYYQYIQEKVGRPVMTHEFAEKPMQETIHTLSKPDFVELCRTNDGPRVMTLREWISTPEPEDGECMCYEIKNKGLQAMLVKAFDGMGHLYGKEFRVWTSRPDKTTREATPWE